MAKELIVEKIYAGLKNIAQGRKEIPLSQGEDVACAATNMNRGLISGWLKIMSGLGWIHIDGRTIWLSRDYGPRITKLSDEEKAILEDVYGDKKGKKVIEARQGKEEK